MSGYGFYRHFSAYKDIVLEDENWWDVLGVARDASRRDVRVAYNRIRQAQWDARVKEPRTHGPGWKYREPTHEERKQTLRLHVAMEHFIKERSKIKEPKKKKPPVGHVKRLIW